MLYLGPKLRKRPRPITSRDMEIHNMSKLYPPTLTQSIKFHASIPQPESYGLLKVCKVEFALGLGPCGRHVTELHHRIDGEPGLLTITQLSRLPDDLEPPDGFEAITARRKLLSDEDLHRRNRHMFVTYEPEPTHERVIKGYRWGFWPIYEFVESKPKTVVIEGALTSDEITELNRVVNAFDAEMRAWRSRVETKKFVYKISDIHGRIEVVTS